MKRGVKVVALTLSHLAVFAVGAASFNGYRSRAVFQAAAQDPLYRVGLAMALPTDDDASPSLDGALEALAGSGGRGPARGKNS